MFEWSNTSSIYNFLIIIPVYRITYGQINIIIILQKWVPRLRGIVQFVSIRRPTAPAGAVHQQLRAKRAGPASFNRPGAALKKALLGIRSGPTYVDRLLSRRPAWP